MEQPIDGHGWLWRGGSFPEHDFCWRWTGPGVDSFVDLPLAADRPLLLSIFVIHTVARPILASLQISVNGVMLAHASRRGWLGGRLGGRLGHVGVPVEVLARSPGRARVGLRVSRTCSYHEINPAKRDFTRRGVVVAGIEVTPALDRRHRYQDYLAKQLRLVRMRLSLVKVPLSRFRAAATAHLQNRAKARSEPKKEEKPT